MMRPDLSQAPLLRDVDPALLEAAADEASWFSLPAGWRLFETGEDPEAVYFVLSGTLGAFRKTPEGEPQLIGYIRAGEPVGEMAVVAGEPHSASVFALRDSELVALSPDTFNRLVLAHPPIMQNLARLILVRARQQPRRSTRAEPKIYALISTSPTIDLRLRARALRAELETLGRTVAVIGPEAEAREGPWLDALERASDFVLLLSPIADTAWFRACLRQSDRILVFARTDARPSDPLLPDDPSPALQFRLVDLVMLHHGSNRRAATTLEWKKACGAARLFHWRDLNDADTARLARVIAGQTVGLVLSGGGARAYAHIGVLRALHDARVPIDLVGGASMGAIVAACVAMGWSDEEIEARIRKAFVDSNPLGDYVLPVVSLVRGRRVEERLAEHFGEALIEDLHTPFFCVSTDLCAGASIIHETGRLRDALRATISLPGILPPVPSAEGGLLVDGAVLKNFPVDVMRAWHRGSIIGVDVARRGRIDRKDFIDPPGFLSWVLRHGFQNPPPLASLLMRTATLAVDPWEGRARTDLLVTPDMPQLDLRDWKRFDEAVTAGYEAAVAVLKDGFRPWLAQPAARASVDDPLHAAAG